MLNPMVKVRIDLLKKQPFFGRLALLLQVQATTRVRYSATDGEYLYYNHEWFANLPREQREGNVLHEILHLALGHLWRRKKRIAHVWNIAADYVVNDIIIKNNFSLPKDALYSPLFINMNVEKVYDKLIKDGESTGCNFCPSKNPPKGDESEQESEGGDGQKKEEQDKEKKENGQDNVSSGDNDAHNKGKKKGKGKKNQKGKDNTSTGGNESEESANEEAQNDKENDGQKIRKDKQKNSQTDDTNSDGEESGCASCISHQLWNRVSLHPKKENKLRKRWEATVEKLAKERGTVPSGFEELIEELTPREDWKKILVNYLSQSQSDFDWLRRDRRSLSGPFYFPDLYNEQSLENVVFAMDTSGSISSNELNQFLAEVKEVLHVFPKSRGWVIDCDAAVHSVIELKDAKNKKSFYGRGGTSHVPVFHEIVKRKLKPKVLLCFTDLYTEFPSGKPDFPVLWLVTPDGAQQDVPFGRIIKLKEKFAS